MILCSIEGPGGLHNKELERRKKQVGPNAKHFTYAGLSNLETQAIYLAGL